MLPLILNPEREEELLRLTEGRVPAFTHDLVPDYLRTKQEPDVEHKLIQLEHKAASLSYDAAQVSTSKLTRLDLYFELVSLSDSVESLTDF